MSAVDNLETSGLCYNSYFSALFYPKYHLGKELITLSVKYDRVECHTYGMKGYRRYNLSDFSVDLGQVALKY